MIEARGLSVHFTTVFRWVQAYAPEINKRRRPHLRMSGAWFRVDETYVKVGKTCKYLHRAVDKEGQTIESMPSAKRGICAAKRILQEGDASRSPTAPILHQCR
jgi:transposase-like protein